MITCSQMTHEADKLDPMRLAEHYDAHDKPWVIDDEILIMWTCKRCHSTICVLGDIK